MCDSHYKRQGRPALIHNAERKLVERVFAAAFEIDGPAFGRLQDMLNGVRESLFEFFRRWETPLTIPG